MDLSTKTNFDCGYYVHGVHLEKTWIQFLCCVRYLDKTFLSLSCPSGWGTGWVNTWENHFPITTLVLRERKIKSWCNPCPVWQEPISCFFCFFPKLHCNPELKTIFITMWQYLLLHFTEFNMSGKLRKW